MTNNPISSSPNVPISNSRSEIRKGVKAYNRSLPPTFLHYIRYCIGKIFIYNKNSVAKALKEKNIENLTNLLRSGASIREKQLENFLRAEGIRNIAFDTLVLTYYTNANKKISDYHELFESVNSEILTNVAMNLLSKKKLTISKLVRFLVPKHPILSQKLPVNCFHFEIVLTALRKGNLAEHLFREGNEQALNNIRDSRDIIAYILLHSLQPTRPAQYELSKTEQIVLSHLDSFLSFVIKNSIKENKYFGDNFYEFLNYIDNYSYSSVGYHKDMDRFVAKLGRNHYLREYCQSPRVLAFIVQNSELLKLFTENANLLRQLTSKINNNGSVDLKLDELDEKLLIAILKQYKNGPFLDFTNFPDINVFLKIINSHQELSFLLENKNFLQRMNKQLKKSFSDLSEYSKKKLATPNVSTFIKNFAENPTLASNIILSEGFSSQEIDNFIKLLQSPLGINDKNFSQVAAAILNNEGATQKHYEKLVTFFLNKMEKSPALGEDENYVQALADLVNAHDEYSIGRDNAAFLIENPTLFRALMEKQALNNATKYEIAQQVAKDILIAKEEKEDNISRWQTLVDIFKADSNKENYPLPLAMIVYASLLNNSIRNLSLVSDSKAFTYELQPSDFANIVSQPEAIVFLRQQLCKCIPLGDNQYANKVNIVNALTIDQFPNSIEVLQGYIRSLQEVTVDFTNTTVQFEFEEEDYN